MGQFPRRVYILTAELEVYGDWLMALINWQIKLSCPDLRWKITIDEGFPAKNVFFFFFGTSKWVSVPLALDEIEIEDSSRFGFECFFWWWWVWFLSVTQYNFLHWNAKSHCRCCSMCCGEWGAPSGKNWWPSWLWSMSGRRLLFLSCYANVLVTATYKQRKLPTQDLQCTETLKALKQAPVCTHHPPRNKKNIVKTWRVDAMTNDHDIQIHLLPLSPPVFPEADSASCRLGRGRAKWSYRTARWS